MTRPILTSLTRISDLATVPYAIRELPRSEWGAADYVLGEVVAPLRVSARLELACGREMNPSVGDLVVGAWGVRAATLEVVGDWQGVDDDGCFDAMTAAGLFGQITSISPFIGDVVHLRYRGHLLRDGRKLTMGDFVRRPAAPAYSGPVVMLIGTSMSSGKTTTGRVVVRQLRRAGLRVVGAKLTGAGRYRDILALQDAGADAIFDFVDSGLPSTVAPREDFERSLEDLLRIIGAARPDVVVAEAGASPLEPYNGDAAIDRLRGQIRCTILCASDPYAVVGVTRGFGFQPDVVCGVATATTAGCRVIERLSGLIALNAQNPASQDDLERLVRRLIEM